jgi:hypothetical protein
MSHFCECKCFILSFFVSSLRWPPSYAFLLVPTIDQRAPTLSPLHSTSTSLPHPSLPSPLHAPLISTLSTPPTLSTLFTAHSHFFSEYLRKKEDMRVFGGAVEGDEVRELVEELRGLGEGYVGEEEEEGEGEEE